MQIIQITLQDSTLEQAVLRLTQDRQQNLQEFVITALRHYVQTIEQPLKIPKLDPLRHSQPPLVSAMFTHDVKVFEDVEDSAVFAKQLRKQAWRDE